MARSGIFLLECIFVGMLINIVSSQNCYTYKNCGDCVLNRQCIFIQQVDETFACIARQKTYSDIKRLYRNKWRCLGIQDKFTSTTLFEETIATPIPSTSTQTPETTTKAPVITTKAPEITTKAPEITTTAPITTTEAPETTTEAPETTTEAPETTTEAPETTTEAPETTTEAPETTTPASETTTITPEITTKASITTTEALETTTQASENTTTPEAVSRALDSTTSVPHSTTYNVESTAQLPEEGDTVTQEITQIPTENLPLEILTTTQQVTEILEETTMPTKRPRIFIPRYSPRGVTRTLNQRQLENKIKRLACLIAYLQKIYLYQGDMGDNGKWVRYFIQNPMSKKDRECHKLLGNKIIRI